MVHYYCYHEYTTELGVGSKVFKVRVGDSQRDQIKKFFVDSYAVRKGFFFRLWDADTEVILKGMQKEDVISSCLSPFAFDVVLVDIVDLSRAIMSGAVDQLENSTAYYSAMFRESSALNPTFRALYFRLPQSQPALTSKSKNLSNARKREATHALICSSLILALFLLASCLEGMEHLFY